MSTLTQTDEAIVSRIEAAGERIQRVHKAASAVIFGQEQVIERTLVTILSGGHALLIGVPGLAKTLLVETLGKILGLDAKRIQFTPDLMPSDIIGAEVLEDSAGGRRNFRFVKGPIFAQLLMADEINRASPKTQSALLQAMQEHSVTVAGQTYRLPEPFFVLATQNPLEMEGTYPLPEAQLDRFLCKLLVKFPNMADIESILDRTTEGTEVRAEATLSGERILEMSRLARQIPVADEVRRYGIGLVLATHPDNELATDFTRRFVRYGASPRGAQAMILAAKIRAILDERYHVAREDLQAVAPSVLRHRLILNFEGQAEGIHADAVIEHILENLKEPAQAA